MGYRKTVPRVTVVIPARNEAKNLREVLPQLSPDHEIVLVDGNSADDTVQSAKELRPDVLVVQQTRRGKGNALVCGMSVATGDIVVLFDADGSADPKEIPAFVRALVDGADYAKGSRFTVGGGSEDITPFRALGNWGLNVVANLLLGTKHSDLCYGYNAMWRDAVPRLDLPDPWRRTETMEWGDGFEIEALLSCRVATGGLRVAEVPSVELNRIHGDSNLKAIPDGVRVLRTLLVERFGREARERRAAKTRAFMRPLAAAEQVPDHA